MKFFILGLIKLYQNSVSKVLDRISPKRGCRFYPSCSVYFSQAVEKYGTIKGSLKGIKRILKCNPFNDGGIDIC